MGVDALAVGREHRIEKAQEHLRVGVVVRGDGALVGIDLPEQQRLDEAPGRHERMTVVERGAERERLQHVALEIDVALQIGLGDVALIERAQRLERALVAEANAKLFLAEADLALLPARQLDREGRRKSAQAIEKRSSVVAADDILGPRIFLVPIDVSRSPAGGAVSRFPRLCPGSSGKLKERMAAPFTFARLPGCFP